MDKYVFYDADLSGFEEYDIQGEAYETLIRTCCQHSSVLYLKYTWPESPMAKVLEPFEIERPPEILEDPWSGQAPPIEYLSDCSVEEIAKLTWYKKRYYRVCPELCDLLLRTASGIFAWMNGRGFNNPEDPIFYRSDGTVFFDSEIHEGVCAITPRPDENVDALLQAVDWLSGDDIRFFPPI